MGHWQPRGLDQNKSAFFLAGILVALNLMRNKDVIAVITKLIIKHGGLRLPGPATPTPPRWRVLLRHMDGVTQGCDTTSEDSDLRNGECYENQ